MKALVILFFITCSVCFSQKKLTEGDELFFQYAYQKAIKAYEKDLVNGYLGVEQYLNLADSYYQVGNFE